MVPGRLYTREAIHHPGIYHPGIYTREAIHHPGIYTREAKRGQNRSFLSKIGDFLEENQPILGLSAKKVVLGLLSRLFRLFPLFRVYIRDPASWLFPLFLVIPGGGGPEPASALPTVLPWV